MTRMTEEIALVSGSTGDTPDPVGRVSITKNRPHDGGRIGQPPEPETTDTNYGETIMDKYEAHCAMSGCSCTHDYCYKGWIDSPTGTSTAPCPYCRESLDERLHRAQAAKAKGYPQAAVQRILTTVKR